MNQAVAPVPYLEARASIRTGDIVFIGGAKGLFSWLITTVTRSSFSHVGIACWMTDVQGEAPTLFLVEANAAGRRLVSMDHYGLTRPMTVVESPVEWIKYRTTLLDRTGFEPYGFLDLIGIAIKERLRINVRDFSGEVCSEMVATVLNANGFQLDETLSPGKLYNSLLEKSARVLMATEPKKYHSTQVIT